MSRAEQERLVERYLGGMMNSAEEEDFFIQVAIDHDLRQTLKSYRIMESAIRKHRDTAPVHHADSRSRVMAMLTVGTMAQQQTQSSSGSSVGTTGGKMWGMSSAALRVVATGVATGAVIIGALVVLPRIQQMPQQNTDPMRTTPAQQLVLPHSEPAQTPVTGPVRSSDQQGATPRSSNDQSLRTPTTDIPESSPERLSRTELRDAQPESPRRQTQPNVVGQERVGAPAVQPAASGDVTEPKNGAPSATTRDTPERPRQVTDSSKPVRFDLDMPN